MNQSFQLTKKQFLDLKELERQVSTYQVFRRSTALRMKHSGFNNTEIARALDVSRVSVGRWIHAYETEAIPGIARNNYKQKKAKLGLREWCQIKIAHSNGEIRCGWVLQRYVEINFGISYNQEYLRKRAHDNYGISFRD